jgi:SAM-dependent methyltransferase
MGWSAGYVTEVDYTYGYYREQCPRLIEYQLLLNSYEPPSSRSMCYLELGYGQGVSANVHAAAVPGRFVGTDINPAHATHAQTLAHASNADVHFFDESFAEFLNRRDLPEFDYIALHGIWSWVSEASRGEIVEIIRRRLKVGGAAYISYNALPGWAAQMPLRHLLKLHTVVVGNDSQSLARRIDASIEFAKRIRDTQARYFMANSSAGDQLDRLVSQDRKYLAHEYLNLDWVPMYYSEVNERLTAAKLSFACPASPLDSINHINFTPPQLEIIRSYENDALQQSIRDYFLNTPFRRDVFTRGARRLTRRERFERLSETEIVLTAARADFPYSVQGGIGTVSLRREIYDALFDVLEEDRLRPKSLMEISRWKTLAHLSFDVVIEAVTVLIGSGFASPAQSSASIEIAEPRCRDLNAHILNNARLGTEINCLASPVTGGGITIGSLEQLFLAARKRGSADPNAWADSAWAVLKSQGRSLMKDGKALGTEEENVAELRVRASRFASVHLPILLALRAAG